VAGIGCRSARSATIQGARLCKVQDVAVSIVLFLREDVNLELWRRKAPLKTELTTIETACAAYIDRKTLARGGVR
jgi:hypothetical protein